jgi:hypothetical protein
MTINRNEKTYRLRSNEMMGSLKMDEMNIKSICSLDLVLIEVYSVVNFYANHFYNDLIDFKFNFNYIDIYFIFKINKSINH